MPLRRGLQRQLSFRAASGFAAVALLALFSLSRRGENVALGAEPKPAPEASVEFSRDVRPILSDKCFKCHGPDSTDRQAGLRLDLRSVATAKLESGKTAIVPAKPEESELVARIFSKDKNVHMPPPDSNKKLTDRQRQMLKQWIAEGAAYSAPWSLVAPVRPPLPAVKQAAWPRNAIDRFVLARLETEGLSPSPEADKSTLIRRVSLDLTGLPPTPAEVAAFAADNRPDAYQRLVDRLLASPHYGERMAIEWLDAARYADTHGFHIDSGRDMWRWREWVIAAFNSNKPFDQFTVEQLAGDLLPHATVDQQLATGFNRNHMINFEGGAIPEEYQTAYIVDRVNTVSTVWMGLTMACSECHDHKFDPLTMKDYFGMYAFFNNVPEQGLDGQKGNAAPFIKVPTADEQARIDELTHLLADAQKKLDARAAEAAPAQAEWEKQAVAALGRPAAEPAGLTAHYALDETKGDKVVDAAGHQQPGTVHGKPIWEPGKIGGALRLGGGEYVDLGTGISLDRGDRFSYGGWVNPATSEHMAVVSRMDDADSFRGWDLYLGDGKVYVHLIHHWEDNAIRVNTKQTIPVNQWTHLLVTYDGSSKAAGVKLYINGAPAELEITHDRLSDTIHTDKPAHIGRRNPGAVFKGLIDDVRIYNRDLSGSEAAQVAGIDPIRPILTLAPAKRTPEQQDQLRRYFLTTRDEPYKKLSAEVATGQKQLAEVNAAVPTSMVMQELPQPRDTFMLIRGQYDKRGAKITANTPASLPPLPPDAPHNRLGLACWLVGRSHPLTARVAVNRYWQMYFGTGIVKTAEDFGSQGEWPSHPELLDWLAVEFMESGWNVRAMQRLIVTSAAYRQSSNVTPKLVERDPENRLLARGPRFRLPAELIRDQALSASGLLNDKIGGPSVFPYQPPGLWEEMAFGGGFSFQTYVPSKGSDLYRRTMYTFWKRTVPPAALSTFDAPDRETCTVRRLRTNTPLQSLVLMNDPTYVEAARKLAERIMTEAGPKPDERIAQAFRLALARQPTAAESAVLGRLFDQQLAVYRGDSAAAQKLLHVGDSPHNKKLDPAELAAWSVVASAILNLDETITKN
jgi:hypothetical protein